MNIPNDVCYTKSHEWVKFAEDGSATVGLTDYAQNELGDLVFVNLPMPGDTFAAGDTFADVESVKAVSDWPMLRKPLTKHRMMHGWYALTKLPTRKIY